MKIQTKKTTKNVAIVLILSLSLIFGGSLQTAAAQNLTSNSNFSVHLAITPSKILEGSGENPVGYVYILNKNGVPISSSSDVNVILTSDNPLIASVPENIIFPARASYAKFDINAGNRGQTTITASINERVGVSEIIVGSDPSYLPGDLLLELNFPTNKMHVNSEMPFTVFLKTTDGNVVRAPFDLDVTLDFEKALAVPNNDLLTIKEGSYYAWGTITTGQKVGNAFIRAIQDDTQLDTAQSIEITSTLPAALSINVYPYLVPAEINRTLDIFVSVLDSNGDPTIANEDIPLKFFSNNQDYLGEDLDDFMKENKTVIKKGQFGALFKLSFDLIGLNANDLFIGVSSPGYGTAIDKFQTVCESISVEDQRIQGSGSLITSSRVVAANDKKAVQLFGPLKIPSNATAIFGYQMAIVENDDDDDKNDTKRQNSQNQCKRPSSEDFKELDIQELISQQEEEESQRREGLNAQDIAGIGDVEGDSSSSSSGGTTSDTDLDVVIYSIDNLADGNLYPLQANEDYRSTGLIQYLDVISEDSSLGDVIDTGKISPSYSYGVAKIKTAQKSGEFLISANIKGIGTGSFKTEVVNSLEQKEIRAFSPTGKEIVSKAGKGSLDSILINRDGSFDLFLVALDGSQRPKVLEQDNRYLITPSNGLVDLTQGSTFDKITLQSESFKLEDGSEIALKVESIGQDAIVAIKSERNFETQLSSKLEILFPMDKLDVEKDDHVGVVHLVDLQGTPVPAVKDFRIKISSSDESIIKTNVDAVIKQGSSYAEFPIQTIGKLGTSTLSANARGVIGAESEISTVSSASSLTVFTSGLIEPIPVNQEIQVKLFVDADAGDSIAGAIVRIQPNANATTTVDQVRTGPDGSATFGLTALDGPEISIDFSASAEGYEPGKKKIDIAVDTPQGGIQVTEVNLPQELVYVIIGGIAVVAVVVGLFLKKSKEPLEDEEEPWEEEDI